MKIQDVRSCSFQNWYEDFKKVTIKSIILPLPDDVTEYLLKDGIILPKNNTIEYSLPVNSSDDDSDQESWGDENEADESIAPHFAEFDKHVEESIERLGGKVFPKLNWSSPRDASWIALNNTCCCTTAAEIYLLLKSSEFIVHDLTQRFMLCEDFSDDSTNEKPQDHGSFFLVLRKWVSIDASGEFRCFVKDQTLIGVCQREESLYFEHIGNNKEEIIRTLVYFFENCIKLKFPCQCYVFDVFLRRRGQVYLIDFNPFGSVTDSLLFSWTELNSGCVKVNDLGLPEFRYVSDQNGVKPSTLRQYAVPRDIIDISTGKDSHKLVDLLKAKIDEQSNSNRNESSDEDETWKA